MDKILSVKNLRISFRTNSGILKAVRDISFDVERGKTIAIVGESGSGKSVTSKAILGIQAGNSITEHGEILFDGKDLLKISEEEMYKIRGDQIAMIFQDPLSSLNPIVKIGQQITEGMILKNKANRKEGRVTFNRMLKALKEQMLAAWGEDFKQEIETVVKTFDDFNIVGLKLEEEYNNSENAAKELVSEIEDLLYLVSKRQNLDAKTRLNEIVANAKKIPNKFLTKDCQEEYDALSKHVINLCNKYNNIHDKKDSATLLTDDLTDALNQIRDLANGLGQGEKPNFFRIGYVLHEDSKADVYSDTIENTNKKALEILDAHFMKRFIELTQKAVQYSDDQSISKSKLVVEHLTEAKAFFAKEGLTKSEALKKAKELGDEVNASIDPLEIKKDSYIHTFSTSMVAAINQYFNACVSNPKEQKRFDKQTAKRNALLAKGRNVDWKVRPAVIYDLDELKEGMQTTIDAVVRHENRMIGDTTFDVNVRTIELVDLFKAKASQVVYKVTNTMAKDKALKLMEEVGIPEPRIRFYQYPFEFSGGMRQRIVIAIALSADPDILICDEPTTALDVTIQSQILELINDLKKKRNLSVIFITHDLGVVANMADTIAVMYAGKIVEYGTADDIFYDPRHPYTWALLSSMPDLESKDKLDAIPGTPPNMIYPPVGDAFAERNKYAMQIDFEMQPPFFQISDTHKAATWLLHPDAPKVEIPKAISARIARMKKKAEEMEEGGIKA